MSIFFTFQLSYKNKSCSECQQDVRKIERQADTDGQTDRQTDFSETVTFVQVSSACLTNKEVHWFYIYKNIIHLAPPLLHSCGLQLPEPPEANLSEISVSPNGLKTFSLFV